LQLNLLTDQPTLVEFIMPSLLLGVIGIILLEVICFIVRSHFGTIEIDWDDNTIDNND